MKSLFFWSVAGLGLGLGWGWLDRTVENESSPAGPAGGKEVRSGNASPAAHPVPLEGPGGRQLALMERIATASRENLVRLTQEVLSGKQAGGFACWQAGGSIRKSLRAAVAKPAAPSILSESIAWEREMWQMDIADFPAAFEEECRTAVESGQAFRLMQI